MKNEPQMTMKTRKLVLVLSLIISYVALRVDGSSLSGAPGSQYNEESIFECFRGHYRPNLYCHFRPGSLLLDHAGQFEVLSQQPPPPLLGGDSAFSIWDIKISNKRLTFGCNVVPEPVIIFTIHYDGSCNHFHLHYDTLLPLFALLEKKNWLTKKVLLMPTVENSWRGEPGIAWDTAAFRPEQLGSAPFLSALRALAFAPDAVVPLSSEFLKDGCHLFSNEVIFGVPKLERTNEPSLLERFVQHMQLRLGIVESSHAASLALDIKGGVIPGVASALPHTMPLRAAFISRRGRRRVLNEDELVGAVNESGIIAMDKIDFEGMTFKDQVAAVGRYGLIVGMQGAGMINAIYRPRGSPVITLLQYGATHDCFHDILSVRGPYFQWRNEVASNSFHDVEKDPFGDSPDTLIPCEDFTDLLKKVVTGGI